MSIQKAKSFPKGEELVEEIIIFSISYVTEH